MLLSTKGIVLQTVKYSENSIIAQIYTRQLGLKSYMVKGVGKSKSSSGKKQNVFQPLSILDLVVYNKPSGGLQHIKEIKPSVIFRDIPVDLRKTSILLFLHEVLYKCIKEEFPNEEFFDFIEQSLLELDETQLSVADFHLYFMLGMSQYLGFAPLQNFSEGKRYFNLVEGQFEIFPPAHNFSLNEGLSKTFSEMLCFLYGQINVKPHVAYSEKQQLLHKIIDYYKLHVAGFQQVNSCKVLEELFA